MVADVYEGFLALLMGYTKQDVQIRSVTDELHLPHQELYKASVAQLLYFKALSKLMKTADIRDFRVQDDLNFPQPKRLHQHLSALINFAKFREEKLEGYTQLTAATDALLQRKQDLEDVRETAGSRLQALRDQLQKTEPEILAVRKQRPELCRPQLTPCAQLTAENALLEKQVLEGNVAQAKRKETVARLKASNAEAKAQMEAHKAQISSAEGDIARLRGAIVENPEQMERELVALHAQVESETKTSAQLAADAAALARKVDTVGKLETDIGQAVEVLQACVEEQVKLNELARKAKEDQTTLERKELELQQAGEKRERLLAELSNVSDKMHRAQKTGKQKEKEAARDVEHAKAERRKAEADMAASLAMLQENDARAAEVEKQLAALQQTHATEMEAMGTLYKALERQVRAYHAEVNAAMRGPA